jgi:hypothetical protein
MACRQGTASTMAMHCDGIKYVQNKQSTREWKKMELICQYVVEHQP